jgi:hypothetical protein
VRVCELLLTDHRLTADCGLFTVYCLLLTADCRLLAVDDCNS